MDRIERVEPKVEMAKGGTSSEDLMMRMMVMLENMTKADREARQQQEDHRQKDQRELLAEKWSES